MSGWSSQKEQRPKVAGHASVYQGIGRPTTEQAFDWPSVNTTLLRAAIYTTCARGDAVSFAQSRDYTSVTVTVLSGGDRFKWYCRTASELDDILARLAQGQAPV